MKKLIATLLGISIAAFSLSFDFTNIVNWTGTGSNEAAMVVDFVDGSVNPAFVWGYRWNGSATGEDMIKAIAASDPNLTYHITTYSFGDALDEFRYDGTSFGLGLHDQVGFGASSTGFWGYWNGNGLTMPTESSWISAQLGFSDRQLSTQDWDGWAWAPNFVGLAPTQDVIAAPQAVPSPAAAYMLASGCLLLIFGRKRRIHAA